MKLTADQVIAACGDQSFESGITITADLEPLAGPGGPVKPAIYAGGVFQHDRRWRGEGVDRRVVSAIVIDNIPSQANRIEAALASLREDLGLPEIVLDLSGVGHLPPHLPREISSFEFPHRNADAYLRDAELNGVEFLKTDIGRAIFAASSLDPAALFEWTPQSLIFGFWQSHLGKKRAQTKLARSFVSEIVGYEPAADGLRTIGIKGDPLNLSTDSALKYDENDTQAWSVTAATKKGSKSKDSLAEVGHGQVPFNEADAALAPVSFSSIEQRSTISFAGLRRITTETADGNAAGRALLVAIALAGHVGAFGRSCSLRSGAELRPTRRTWTWLGANNDEPVDVPDLDTVTELVRTCAQHAENAGLPVGSKWATQPLIVTPQPKLIKVINDSWPLPEDG